MFIRLATGAYLSLAKRGSKVFWGSCMVTTVNEFASPADVIWGRILPPRVEKHVPKWVKVHGSLWL